MILNVIGWILAYLVACLLIGLIIRGTGQWKNDSFIKIYLYTCVGMIVWVIAIGIVIGIGMMITY